ncbi:MAG TPA: hypothetical protein VGM54_20360 [Chthoniobacter sp.]|jgi:hypothetical protein
MNFRTAQTLLRCYRPGKAADSRVDKAVKFAQEDPELSKMLNEQTAFDEQIVEAIHFIKPPDDLRKKLSDLGVKPGAEKGLRKQIINPAVITAILGVLVILGIAVFFVMDHIEKFPGREAVEGMMSAAVKMSPSELEAVSMSTGQLGDWFYVRGYDGFEAPPDLAALQTVGARAFRMNGPMATQMNGPLVAQMAIGEGDTLRCLVFEFHASEFGVQLPPDADWKVLAQDEWVGAIRQHGDHCFLIVFKGTKADMQDFLKTLKNPPTAASVPADATPPTAPASATTPAPAPTTDSK